MFKHVISVDDRTTQVAPAASVIPIKENILILGSFQRGETNTVLQYYPGEAAKMLDDVGPVNYNKYGIGLNIAAEALKNELNMGVMLVNLRPADATISNAILCAKHKVLANVQKLDDESNPLYRTSEGLEVTTAEGNVAIVRDVLQLKFYVSTSTAVKSHKDLLSQLDAARTTTPDAEGYQTTPLHMFYYVGAGAYGDQLSMRMAVKESSFSDDIFYDLEIFNGESYEYVNNVSLFPNAQLYANESAYIENVLNAASRKMNVISSTHLDTFLDLLAVFEADAKTVDLFDIPADHYTLSNAVGSLDVSASRAIVLDSGSNGTASQLAGLYKDFFDGKVVKDIDSITRYRITVVPDLEFAEPIKTALMGFVKRRTRATTAIVALGTNTFESAVAERMNTFKETDDDSVLFSAKVQCPASYDIYTKRKMRLPNIYYMMKAYINNYILHGNSFHALAGADVRISDFDEKSLETPAYGETMDKLLEGGRINVFKMDSKAGAYLAAQNTNTVKISDRTEFNNMCILAHIVYDINDIVHQNGYKFNDLEDVAKLNAAVDLDIKPKYNGYVTGLSTKVYKAGLTGADKNVNYVTIVVNFKDLAKETRTTIVITDETIKS